MKITLFAVRHENKVYEFREPIVIEIIERGRKKIVHCSLGFLYICECATSYTKAIKKIGEAIDFYYKYYTDEIMAPIPRSDKARRKKFLKLITVREIV